MEEELSANDKALPTFILRHFLSLLSSSVDRIGKEVPIPLFESSVLDSIAKQAKYHMASQPTLLTLCSPITIIGDLHGNVIDLIRILKTFEFPLKANLLFLGDYVDRGNFSISTITFLFSLLLCFPKQVYLIRGNHEFRSLNSQYGFYNEIMQQYQSDTLFESFNSAFEFMPLSAVIDDKVLCVHGGIGPTLRSIQQIAEIRRPISNANDNTLVSSLLWADPSEANQYFVDSLRGCGYDYGELALHDFLNSANLTKLIRAHQCVSQGVRYQFGKKVITVFSSSSYEQEGSNKAAIVQLLDTESVIPMTFPPLPFTLKRHDANFHLFHQFLSRGTKMPGQIESQRLPHRRILCGIGFSSARSRQFKLRKVYTSPNKSDSFGALMPSLVNESDT